MFCLIFKLSEASFFLSHAKKEKYIRFKNISKRSDLNTYKILDTTSPPPHPYTISWDCQVIFTISQ